MYVYMHLTTYCVSHCFKIFLLLYYVIIEVIVLGGLLKIEICGY